MLNFNGLLMKRIYSVIAFLLLIQAFFLNYTYAQSDVRSESNATRQETEKWILEKLNKYTEEHYNSFRVGTPLVSYLYKNYYYRFDNYNLIVTFDNITRGDINGKLTQVEQKTECKIPIYHLERLSDYNSKLSFYTNDTDITETTISFKLNETENRVTDYFGVNFKFDAEKDLFNRIVKAFQHLHQFYEKPPVKKEQF